MIKLSIVGDVCINGSFEKKINSNESLVDNSVADFLQQQKFVICNFEGPETENGKTTKKGTALKQAKGAIAYLSSVGFNIFNLANNHICDFGKIGLDDTLNKLKKENVKFHGANSNLNAATKPISLEDNNTSIAIISICEKDEPIARKNSFGIAHLKFKELKHLINECKKTHNWVLLNYHGGEEYTLFPSPKKRNYLTKIAKKTKVDTIVSHHSHTFQGFEVVNNKPVFYSLGNFIFDLENHEVFPYTKQSAILNLTFNNKTIGHSLFPIYIDTKQGIISEGEERFKEHVKSISDFTNYKTKWREECHRVIFNRQEHKTLNPKEKSLQQKSALSMIFSLKLYMRIIHIAFNNKLRGLYLNALIFKFSHKIK